MGKWQENQGYSDVCHWFLLSVQSCDYMKFLVSHFDSKSREMQEELWISFVIGSTLKPRRFRGIYIYLLNTKYHKQVMAITNGNFTALHLLMCTAVKWVWTISGTSHESRPRLWAALCSGETCAGHSHQPCCQGLQKSNQSCSMSLLWKNLGSDLGCKLTSACPLQSVDMKTLLNSCTARVTCMDHLGLSKQTALWLRACSMWAVLAGLSSWGRNHEPVAHMSGEQVNFKSSNAKIVGFFQE